MLVATSVGEVVTVGNGAVGVVVVEVPWPDPTEIAALDTVTSFNATPECASVRGAGVSWKVPSPTPSQWIARSMQGLMQGGVPETLTATIRTAPLTLSVPLPGTVTSLQPAPISSDETVATAGSNRRLTSNAFKSWSSGASSTMAVELPLPPTSRCVLPRMSVDEVANETCGTIATSPTAIPAAGTRRSAGIQYRITSRYR